MDVEIKQYVDKIVSEIGLYKAISSFKDLGSESRSLKNKLLFNNLPLSNVDSHIEMSNEILDYLNELVISRRQSSIDKILSEKNILKFKEFNNLF